MVDSQGIKSRKEDRIFYIVADTEIFTFFFLHKK